MGSVQVRRSAGRFVTGEAGIVSRHSFSFGPHYDPGNTSYGLLLMHAEHLLEPGAGFGPHPHRDLEVVTWLLDGALAHENSSGEVSLLRPGQVQRLSAGTGVRHAERNAAAGATRFVQMWIAPDEGTRAASYEQGEVDPGGGRLVPVASGRSGQEAAVRLGNRHATLHVARLGAAEAVPLPAAPYVHLYVAEGDLDLDAAGRLEQGDAARLTRYGGGRICASRPSLALVWEMHVTPGTEAPGVPAGGAG